MMTGCPLEPSLGRQLLTSLFRTLAYSSGQDQQLLLAYRYSVQNGCRLPTAQLKAAAGNKPMCN